MNNKTQKGPFDPFIHRDNSNSKQDLNRTWKPYYTKI